MRRPLSSGAQMRPPAAVVAKLWPPAAIDAQLRPSASVKALMRPPPAVDAELRPPTAADAQLRPPASVEALMWPPRSDDGFMQPPSTTAQTRLVQSGGHILHASRFGDLLPLLPGHGGHGIDPQDSLQVYEDSFPDDVSTPFEDMANNDMFVNGMMESTLYCYKWFSILPVHCCC
jgi:hypothetical protein